MYFEPTTVVVSAQRLQNLSRRSLYQSPADSSLHTSSKCGGITYKRLIMKLVRSTMRYKRVTKRFWAEALSTAVYVRNRVTKRLLPTDTTPNHVWIETSQNESRMCVFRYKCWYVIPCSKVQKLYYRSYEAIIAGNSLLRKGISYGKIRGLNL